MKAKAGTVIVVATFRSSAVERRTKLPVPLIREFSAEHSDILYFQKENNAIVVTKYPVKRGILLFQITVDVDTRARLTETKLKQLGAVFGDKLEFKFIGANTALVRTLKQPAESEALNVLPLAEEVEDSQTYIEGATRQITINDYERDPRARQACIDYYGFDCYVCGFNFEESYGEVGRNFIHVHHLIPISSIGKQYELDPKRDLRPVCPNCHAIIHKRKPPYTVEEVQRILRTSN